MPYIDSAGIGCLVGAHVSRENSGRKLVLVGANERLQTSLKVTKVRPAIHHGADRERRAGQVWRPLRIDAAPSMPSSDRLSR